VIDHHQTSMRKRSVPFSDIRPKVAAAATIAASYLREQKMPPDEQLATALLYGIRSETEGIAASHSRLDRSMISWLSHCANPTTLAAIENAPLTRGYFSDLVLALQNTFVYEDAAFCFLPRAEGSETVGEVADLLARAEGVNRVLCAAVNNGDIVVSVRTERNTDRASTLVREVVDGLGQAGGHEHRAGGRIHDFRRRGADTDDMQQHLRSAWLKACGVQKKRGKRLVALREIVKNL
jgi:nanoRNase/pAp phosphatase (c-di-AMP/oligoRNAs hydrolase)